MIDEPVGESLTPGRGVTKWRVPGIARSRFLRDISGMFGANTVTVVVSIVQSIIVARALGANGKGIITFGVLLPSTAIVLVDAGFTSSNIYYASKASATDLLRNAFTFIALASVLVWAVFAAGRSWGSLFDTLPTSAFVPAIALVPVLLAISQLGAILIGLGRVAYVNGVSILQACTTFVLVGAAVLMGGGPATILFCVVVSTLFASLVLVRRILAEGARLRLGWDRQLLWKQVGFGIRDHAGNLVQFLNYRLDQFIVSAYLGATALGVYSVSVSIAELLWVVPSAAGVLTFARAARIENEALNRTTPVLLRLLFALSLAGGIAIALLGRWLIVLMYSEAFVGAYDALLLLLPGAVLLGLGKVMAGEIAGRGHPGLNSVPAGVGAVVTIALDLVLIPRYGVRGAAGASSVAYALVTALYWRSYRRLRSEPTVAVEADGSSAPADTVP